MDRDVEKGVVRLKGNIQLVFQGYYLSCKRATIYLNDKIIEAVGNVILKNEQIHAEGSKVLFNYGSKTATFYDGFIQSGQVIFEGQVIEKIGEHEYIATKARYSACTTCPADWSFTGSKIHAEIGGYAHISQPVLRIANVPVAWLPGLIVPLKSSRQSGFLVPSWEQSGDGGLAIAESFFWAISRSQDMTLTAKNYEFRGPKGLLEYRYVLSPQSHGMFRTAYIPDRAFEGASREEPFSRWFIDYRHRFELPESFINHVQIRNASDLQYQRDFYDELSGHGDPSLESRISLTKNLERSHFSVDSQFHINLLQENSLADNQNAVHRIPELRYSLTESRVFDSDLLFNFDLNYVNFSREGFSYDDINRQSLSGNACDTTPSGKPTSNCLKTQRDGAFNADSDLMRVGQRLDIQPAVTYPIPLSRYVTFLPKLKYRETQYSFPVAEGTTSGFYPTAARRYAETSLAMQTRLSRVYGNTLEPQGRRYKHEIEPVITYSKIPWVRHPDHEFFGDPSAQQFSRILDPISDEDVYGVTGLQFDYNDRLFNEDKIDFNLTNRFILKKWNNDQPEYKTLGILRMWQSYDFYEAKTENPQPWSAVYSLLDIRLDRFETNTFIVHHPYAQVTNTSSRVKFISEYGDFLQLSYSRSLLVKEKSVIDRSSETENYSAGIGAVTRYINLSGQVDYSNITHRVQSWQYTVVLNSPGRCWAINFLHHQIVGGEYNIKFNFAFKFDGETTSSSSWL